MELIKTQELNRIFKTLWFFSYKNMRKRTIEDVYDEYKDNMPSSIKGTRGDYSYFIVWKAYEGIRSFVFNKEGKLMSERCDNYRDVKEMENITIKYIDIITRRLKKLETNK